MGKLTPSNARYELVNVSLDAVALCGAGANTRAHILLTKRKEQDSMSFEELIKALNDEQAATINAHFSAQRAASESTIEKLQGELEELRKSIPPVKEEPQVVLKDASPEIKEMVEKMQGTINSLLDERNKELVNKRFEKCKALPVEEETLRDVLKSASPAVCEILEKAAAAIEKSTHTAKGSNADGAGIPDAPEQYYKQLEKKANEFMAADGTTFEQAFSKACSVHPDLYAKYTKGV